jgi:putative two-component system response regulator
MDSELDMALARLTAAVAAIGAGHYERVDLGTLPARADGLGYLANAIDAMCADVATREASLRRARHDAVHRLVMAAEYKDSRTLEHIERMSRYAAMLARRAGLGPSDVELLREASTMHDVGKIGVPEEILLKPGSLDAAEWSIMRRHTEVGATILRDTISELLKAGEVIALTHHERWDGSGYPYGLAGEAIPLSGRICAVADVFDALTSERPYKRAYSVAEAFEIMSQGRGTHFDPQLLDLFVAGVDEIDRIRDQAPV